MTPFHCSNCNKLLGMVDGKAEIKCPRCKTMNKVCYIHPNLLREYSDDCKPIEHLARRLGITPDDVIGEYKRQGKPHFQIQY